MRKIYMDYSATSPVNKEVLKEMIPYFTEKFGNPSSIHSFGQDTRKVINHARSQVAHFLNCQSNEVIFTSGGTESDNFAIRGIVERYKENNIFGKPHIITSMFEHHAVLHTCELLEKEKIAEVTYLKPTLEGIIKVEDVKNAIKPNTILVSIMYVNNEIGTAQPIAQIGKMIKKLKVENLKLKTIFHTDAVQAAEYYSCNVDMLNVDLLSLSAHKFGGPKGVGVLYVSKDVILKAILTGGAQEFHLRAGTENVAGIVGMGKAVELLGSNRSEKNKQIQKLRDRLIDGLIKKIVGVNLNGSRKLRSPNNVNISFKNVEGESVLLNLDLKGVAASSGSACTSGSLEPSHVLSSIGCPPEQAHGAVRFTLGENTKKEDVDYVVKNLVEIIKKLRNMSPYK